VKASSGKSYQAASAAASQLTACLKNIEENSSMASSAAKAWRAWR